MGRNGTGVNERSMLVAVDPDGITRPVRVDALGQFLVVGGGVVSASDIRLRDATQNRYVAVDASGRLTVVLTDLATLATETTLAAVLAAVDTLETKLQSLIDAAPALTLTARMKQQQPKTNYRIWSHFDITTNLGVGDLIAEAPQGTTDQATLVWDGVFIPEAAGEWKERTAFAWQDRTTGW